MSPEGFKLFFFLCDGHTKNRVVRVSEFVVSVWDGLDECEISRPKILFQSAPAFKCHLHRANSLNVLLTSTWVGN